MRKILLSTLAGSLLMASPALALDFSAPHADHHARHQFEIGVDLVEHQKFEEAIDPLSVALDQFPDDTSILTYLGFAHRMIARHRSGTAHDAEQRLANDYYIRALDIDPRQKDLLEYMGQLYLEMDDPAAASAKLAALTRECPNGCAQRDTLQASIAAYKPMPPAPIVEVDPAEKASAPDAPPPPSDATGAPAPLAPPPPTDD